MTDQDRPSTPVSPVTLSQYQIVAARRQTFDTLMWQVPALSLTAQSFLLSIAYGEQSSRLAAAVAGALSAVVAVMSIQLLLRHRQNELTDSITLNLIERAHGWQEMFAPGEQRASAAGLHRRRLIRLRSFRIWTGGLGIFGLAGTLAFVVALVR
ncbi:hypothetical protein [Actinophytocola sp.]|uniref:hypothetical protein n=1 Tax=Actinophytocola sp. TaxID=1872138 RepID=UPI002ED62D2D